MGQRLFIKANLLAIILFLIIILPVPSWADIDDYDAVTGEPKCMKCHTPDRRFSIDYSRDETCAECHGPALSDEYLEINSRFRQGESFSGTHPPIGAPGPVMVAAATNEKLKPKSKSTDAAPDGMVLVPGGEYTMGSNDWWPKSQPEHLRTLNDFYIDKYEVTNLQYKAFVEGAGYKRPKHWKGGIIPQGKESHPVVFVNWFDADNYCRWKGLHLPSEPEWEKATRGTDKRTFPWGDKFDKAKGNTPQYGNEDTMEVGSFPQGVSPYGIHDLAGNVFEWTSDWFTPYPGNNHPDENYGERYKVVRGGSWYDCTYYKCGISAPAYNRIFFNPYTKNNNFGFRCAGSK